MINSLHLGFSSAQFQKIQNTAKNTHKVSENKRTKNPTKSQNTSCIESASQGTEWVCLASTLPQSTWLWPVPASPQASEPQLAGWCHEMNVLPGFVETAWITVDSKAVPPCHMYLPLPPSSWTLPCASKWSIPSANYTVIKEIFTSSDLSPPGSWCNLLHPKFTSLAMKISPVQSWFYHCLKTPINNLFSHLHKGQPLSVSLCSYLASETTLSFWQLVLCS